MKNKKVLIVGGSSGIGLSVGQQIAKAGAEVFIASRSALDKEAEIKNLPGLENTTLFSVDITSEEQIQDMLRDLGKIDHLVFTIKAPLITGEFLELDNVDVRHAFETKFWGQYNFTKLAKASINDGGSIIFTSGTLAVKPYQGYSTMGVIAGAVDSLCKSLAVELAPLRVNAVSPGYKSLEELEETIPLGLGCSEKMANPYLFLMNDSYTTGTSLVCDGGAILV